MSSGRGTVASGPSFFLAFHIAACRSRARAAQRSLALNTFFIYRLTQPLLDNKTQNTKQQSEGTSYKSQSERIVTPSGRRGVKHKAAARRYQLLGTLGYTDSTPSGWRDSKHEAAAHMHQLQGTLCVRVEDPFGMAKRETRNSKYKIPAIRHTMRTRADPF